MPLVLSDSFTRPANTTQYTVGDCVADNATAASVTPLTFATSRVVGQGTITRVRVYKSDADAVNAVFAVHLFKSSPTVSAGDNGAFGVSSAAYHIGSVDCDMSAGAVAGTAGLSKAFDIPGGITFDLSADANPNRYLYALIEAREDYTPGSGETFQVDLEVKT